MAFKEYKDGTPRFFFYKQINKLKQMALQNGTNQNDNSEPTKIEEVSGITNAVDLTNVEPVERLVQLNQTLFV
jgi:hypothetical protein